MAPAQVLQGAVRLQGLTSSPTPDTHVRVACACAMEATVNVKMTTANICKVKRTLLMMHSPFGVELNCNKQSFVLMKQKLQLSPSPKVERMSLTVRAWDSPAAKNQDTSESARQATLSDGLTVLLELKVGNVFAAV